MLYSPNDSPLPMTNFKPSTLHRSKTEATNGSADVFELIKAMTASERKASRQDEEKQQPPRRDVPYVPGQRPLRVIPAMRVGGGGSGDGKGHVQGQQLPVRRTSVGQNPLA